MQYRHSNYVLCPGKIWLIIVIAAFIFRPLAAAVAAEEDPDEQSGWQLQVAPYLWAISRMSTDT